jgi:hypothetical protein
MYRMLYVELELHANATAKDLMDTLMDKCRSPLPRSSYPSQLATKQGWPTLEPRLNPTKPAALRLTLAPAQR